MVKLQHQRERGPGEHIWVNGTQYELDEEGNIECSEEDAAKLLQGKKWRPPEYWAERQHLIAKHTPPPIAPGGGRRVRTRAEMLATAEASGIPVEEPKEEDKPEERAISSKSPEAVEAAQKADQKAKSELLGEEEVVEVSEDMTKAELLKLAADMGIKADRSMTKATLLGLFSGE